MGRWLFSVALLVAGLAGAETLDESVGERADLTPRAAMRSFLGAVRAGARTEAVELLSPEVGGSPDDRWERARQLEAVIDSRLPDDLEAVSDLPEGRTDDRLSPNEEDVGRVPAATGHGLQPIRLVRAADGRWHFSATTTARVPAWYAQLPDRWLRDRLPPVLFLPGPRGLFWWQLLALPLLALLAWGGGRLVSSLARRGLERLTAQTETDFDDLLVDRMSGPLTLFAGTAVAWLSLPLILPTAAGQAFLESVLSSLALLSLYWALIRAVELAAEFARHSPLLQEKPQIRALIPLGVRAAKTALTVIAVVVVLQKLGYPAASLIAGLGIGGLAFALAAQKTVENLFGSVMLSLDQPFRPGDYIKVEDVVGTVEVVGLRSTRVRTAERTVVTIPNGRLADLRIESFAARDQMRLLFTIGVTYDTPAATLRAIVDELRAQLEQHPRRHPESVLRVLLTTLGPSSLDIEVLMFMAVTDTNEFMALRQEVLLGAMELVERHGARLAFPSRTIYLAGSSEAAAAATRPARVA